LEVRPADIEATGSNFNAILSGFITNPVAITVRSNFGGFADAHLTS
jgi:hypothetical protein